MTCTCEHRSSRHAVDLDDARAPFPCTACECTDFRQGAVA